MLYQLGPDCASSHQQAVETVIRRNGFGISLDMANDTSVIDSPPISREEIQSLMQVGGGGVSVICFSSPVIHLCFVAL